MEFNFSFNLEEADRARLEQARAMVEGIGRVLDLALILKQSGRAVELAGIDRKIGPLCALALDLEPNLGRELAPLLEQQIVKLEQLIILFRGNLQ